MTKKALVITVGTGVGGDGEKACQSLAKGILYSIDTHNPSEVHFIVTEESEKRTLPHIASEDELRYEVHSLGKDFDDVQHCYEFTMDCLKKLLERGFTEHEIIVDFTSGTKPMSAGAAIAALECEVETLSFVSGKREHGVVVFGAEKVVSLRPTGMQFNKRLRLFQHLFNARQFMASLELLDELEGITSEVEKVMLITKLQGLAEGFDAWDRFEHGSALETLKGVRDVPGIDLVPALLFLGKRRDADRLARMEYDMADLLVNARRRASQGRFDDAAARVYRLVEGIGQYLLEKCFGCESSQVPSELVRKKVGKKRWNEEWRAYFGDSESREVGLYKTFVLLCDLGAPDIAKFDEVKAMLKKSLHTRNLSKLAHGDRPVAKADYERFEGVAVELARHFIPSFDTLATQAEMPTIRLVAGNE